MSASVDLKFLTLNLNHSYHPPTLTPFPFFTPTYDLDKWITQLLHCKRLPESDMKLLCDRIVCTLAIRIFWVGVRLEDYGWL